MKATIRIFFTALATMGTFYFVYLLPFSLILPPGRFHLMRLIGSAMCAILAAGYLWRHTAGWTQGLVTCMVLGALITGTIGFAAGFFGPLIFKPGTNQGPLLGIFITGPLGFLGGGVGGALWWRLRRNTGSSE